MLQSGNDAKALSLDQVRPFTLIFLFLFSFSLSIEEASKEENVIFKNAGELATMIVVLSFFLSLFFLSRNEVGRRPRSFKWSASAPYLFPLPPPPFFPGGANRTKHSKQSRRSFFFFSFLWTTTGNLIETRWPERKMALTFFLQVPLSLPLFLLFFLGGLRVLGPSIHKGGNRGAGGARYRSPLLFSFFSFQLCSVPSPLGFKYHDPHAVVGVALFSLFSFFFLGRKCQKVLWD